MVGFIQINVNITSMCTHNRLSDSTAALKSVCGVQSKKNNNHYQLQFTEIPPPPDSAKYRRVHTIQYNIFKSISVKNVILKKNTRVSLRFPRGGGASESERWARDEPKTPPHIKSRNIKCV